MVKKENEPEWALEKLRDCWGYFVSKRLASLNSPPSPAGASGADGFGPMALFAALERSVGALLPRQGAVSSPKGLWAAPTP